MRSWPGLPACCYKHPAIPSQSQTPTGVPSLFTRRLWDLHLVTYIPAISLCSSDPAPAGSAWSTAHSHMAVRRTTVTRECRCCRRAAQRRASSAARHAGAAARLTCAHGSDAVLVQRNSEGIFPQKTHRRRRTLPCRAARSPPPGCGAQARRCCAWRALQRGWRRSQLRLRRAAESTAWSRGRGNGRRRRGHRRPRMQPLTPTPKCGTRLCSWCMVDRVFCMNASLQGLLSHSSGCEWTSRVSPGFLKSIGCFGLCGWCHT